MTAEGYDLLSLASSDTDLRRVGKYYIGPCPFCGGRDRFNLKRLANIDLWICRQCGNGKYESAIGYLMKRNRWSYRQAVESIESGSNVGSFASKASDNASAERKKVLDAKLREYTTCEIWEALHRRMAKEDVHRKWWRDNGVPDDWQDYLSLGWTPEKKYISSEDGMLHSSDAYTIPYFGLGRKFITMQYRLNSVSCPNDRYRFEYGLETSYYLTTPTLPIAYNIVICEGAKKGIVARTMLVDMDGITVVSVPSKNDFGGVENIVGHADKVWIVLDPDAEDDAEKLASMIGVADTLVVSVPMKLDDAFLFGGLTPKQFNDMLRQGVRVS